MPTPRPAEGPGLIAPERPQSGSPLRSRRTRMAHLPAADEADKRSFLEKLFGVQRASAPAAADATANDDQVPAQSHLFAAALFSSSPVPRQGTAVYDISARTVYLPNGERLEAHSGLGDKRDDPRHVDSSMRGATPPHVYDISEREQLFHGVPALRLNPVGGSGAIYGRVGLLAHSYMLGPQGDSNGCISFKNYDKFLQAYRRGDVRRLIVVASAN